MQIVKSSSFREKACGVNGGFCVGVGILLATKNKIYGISSKNGRLAEAA